MPKPKEPNWDAIHPEGPYRKLIDKLREADPHCRFRMGNRYILEGRDLYPKSCIETWLAPNNHIFILQRWADTPGFEYYLPTKDDHTLAAAVKILCEYGGVEANFCGGCGGAPDGSDPECNCPMCRREPAA